jgi:hypothetical protein
VTRKCNSLAQGEGHCLEGCLGAVMIVLAPQHIDMQGQTRSGGKRSEHVADVLTGEAADDAWIEPQVDGGVRAPGKVDNCARQRFVEGRER